MQANEQQAQNIANYIIRSGRKLSCRDVIENTHGILDAAGIISRPCHANYMLINEKLLEAATEEAAGEILYLLQNHPAPLLKAFQTARGFDPHAQPSAPQGSQANSNIGKTR